jgi:hypothetical protein
MGLSASKRITHISYCRFLHYGGKMFRGCKKLGSDTPRPATINIDGGSGYAARTTRRQEDCQIRNIGHPNDATKRHLGTEPALGLILVQAMIAHGSLDQIVPTVGIC